MSADLCSGIRIQRNAVNHGYKSHEGNQPEGDMKFRHARRASLVTPS